jgi:septum formation protein
VQLSSAFSEYSPRAASRLALVLASASPRRADILQTLGVPFTVRTSTFEEPAPTPRDHLEPALFVKTLAREKAAHCEYSPRDFLGEDAGKIFILGADTIVWHDGEILGKPRDEDEARAMLQRLRGQTHDVFSGVCLRVCEFDESVFAACEYSQCSDEPQAQRFHVEHAVTRVHFRDASDEFIERYVRSGEPMDKAGAYAAQGRGMALVENIQGDFWNVVGLPLAPLLGLLEMEHAPLNVWWKT